MQDEPQRLVTTVVGAGPAGLFSIVSKLLFAKAGGDPNRWSITLLDKRTTYTRTHRLRLAPDPYQALQHDVDDPRMDALIALLEEHRWKPVVNVLEKAFSDLAASLNIVRRVIRIGPGPDETSLSALRGTLFESGELRQGDRWTVVGADSVHSATRELVRGAIEPQRKAHQHVARLKIEGDALPERISEVQRYKLAKVLMSVLDYRFNANGYAEVDLFVSPEEFDSVRAFDAHPANPVTLTPETMRSVRAPLFARIAAYYREGVFGVPCTVQLQSMFTLEHTVTPRVVFELPELNAHVFLVGDAAVSLPFFRGMACLVRCAHALAWVHCDLALGATVDAQQAPDDIRKVLHQTRSGQRTARAFGGWVPLMEPLVALPFNQ